LANSIVRTKDRLGVMMNITAAQEQLIVKMSDREICRYIIKYLEGYLGHGGGREEH
jgi:hypothetical protein